MSKKTGLKKWAEIRQKGKWDYIIKHGILRFGVSVYVIMMIYFWLFQPDELHVTFAMVSLITFPLAGLIWGRWMWFYLEKLYAKTIDAPEDLK